jgi:hypothetical protein
MGRRPGLPKGTQLYARASLPPGRHAEASNVGSGVASSFIASIALILPQWGKYRRAAVRYRAIVCGGMHRGHGREELRAAFVAAGRLANSHADVPRGCPW